MTNKALAASLAAVLVVLPASAVRAQTQDSKPQGIKVEQGKHASGNDKAKPMKTASASGRHPMHMNDDARHCLELSTIAEIVKCAEPYRY